MAQPAVDHFTVHEWGSFTVMQDEAGQAIYGLNADDEDLPYFGQKEENFTMPSTLDHFPGTWRRNVPWCHMGVNLRLDTAFYSLYAPASWSRTNTVDLAIDLQGGWPTESYPKAKRVQPGFPANLSPLSTGICGWESVKFVSNRHIESSEDPLWLAARNIDTSLLSAPGDSAEKFLSFRAVSQLESPVQVGPVDEAGLRSIRLRSEALPKGTVIEPLWLVDVTQDGLAFRSLGPLDETGLKQSVEFDAPSHSPNGARELRKKIKPYLVKAGLFEDEAEALLETWKRSHFEAYGTRLFFITPRAWLDRNFRIRCTEIPDDLDPAQRAKQLKRVILGRIDLVNPTQRMHLKRLATMPTPDLAGFKERFWTRYREESNSDIYGKLKMRRASFKEYVERVNLEYPVLYDDYLALGRFRNALLVNEYTRRRTPNLQAWIQLEIGNMK